MIERIRKIHDEYKPDEVINFEFPCAYDIASKQMEIDDIIMRQRKNEEQNLSGYEDIVESC